MGILTSSYKEIERIWLSYYSYDGYDNLSQLEICNTIKRDKYNEKVEKGTSWITNSSWNQFLRIKHWLKN